jgi:uroporphyrinogen III methyltransferase/synthase
VPRSRIGRPELLDGLRERQAIVDDIPIYDTVEVEREERNEMLEKLKKGDIDMVTFTSSSTAENFFAILNEPRSAMKNVRIAVIGQSTARAVMTHGLKCDIIADQPLIENLTDNIVEFYRLNN